MFYVFQYCLIYIYIKKNGKLYIFWELTGHSQAPSGARLTKIGRCFHLSHPDFLKPPSPRPRKKHVFVNFCNFCKCLQKNVKVYKYFENFTEICNFLHNSLKFYKILKMFTNSDLFTKICKNSWNFVKFRKTSQPPGLSKTSQVL